MAHTKFTNQSRRTRNSYPGAGSSLLSNEQKASICIAAREAFENQKTKNSEGLPVSGFPAFESISFRDWRCAEQFKITGKESLTDCTQADYLPLLGHFQNLAGESGRAVKTYLRQDLQDKRVAMFKLREECGARGLELSYAAAICRRQYKCELDQANPRQLWNLVFTVRNRKEAA